MLYLLSYFLFATFVYPIASANDVYPVTSANDVHPITSNAVLLSTHNLMPKKNNCNSDVHIETLVSTFAKGSDVWLGIVNNVSLEFPNVEFSTKWVVLEDLDGNIMLPATSGIFNGVRRKFSYKMTHTFLRRWIRDGMCGHFTLFETISPMDSFMSDNYPVFVHILSEKKPNTTLPKKLPSVGFFWSFSNVSSAKNIFIMRDIYGQIRQYTNFSYVKLLHVLLPPVVPIPLFDNNSLVTEIYSELASEEIIITSDEKLGSWWKYIIDMNDNIGFVMYYCNETSLPCSSVTYNKGRIQYQYLSLNKTIVPWMRGIGTFKTAPSWRLSTEPIDKHRHVFDVTGDNLWLWLKNARESFLYLYGGLDENKLWPSISTTYGQMGRMDITKNAHEILPVNAAPGQCFIFKGTSVAQMNHCQHYVSLKNQESAHEGATESLHQEL